MEKIDLENWVTFFTDRYSSEDRALLAAKLINTIEFPDLDLVVSEIASPQIGYIVKEGSRREEAEGGGITPGV